MAEQKVTPLYSYYRQVGAKLIDFGGYLLPVQLSTIKQEHEAVRTHAGLFDVSHMGEFLLTGTDSASFLQRMVTNDVARAHVGQALYTAMCYENGGTVDDLLIYRLAENHFLLVVNAANIQKDYQWLSSHLEGDVRLTDRSEWIALLAVQGPLAAQVLQKLTDADLQSINRFTFQNNVEVAGVKLLLSRTGYTGEDGFELYCPGNAARALWDAVLAAGEADGLLPCGLGARDTLRFEACLPLCGHELSAAITPLQAGIGFAVRLKKDADFIGKSALRVQKQQGLASHIVGLEMTERAIARNGYDVWAGEQFAGTVTTGSYAPTLEKNVALALVDSKWAAIGTVVSVNVRGKLKQAKVVATPFYRRGL